MGVETYSTGGVEVITQIVTDFSTIFSSVWTFLSSNWQLFIFVALPIFIFLLSSVIGLWTHR